MLLSFAIRIAHLNLNLLNFRLWNNDLQLLLQTMEQDLVHGWSLSTLPCIYSDWVDLFNLLGCADSSQKLARQRGDGAIHGEN